MGPKKKRKVSGGSNTKYNKEFLLYLAGFVDGDGKIFIFLLNIYIN